MHLFLIRCVYLYGGCTVPIEASDAPELELQVLGATMWVQGIELGSLTETVCVLKHQSIFLAPLASF